MSTGRDPAASAVRQDTSSARRKAARRPARRRAERWGRYAEAAAALALLVKGYRPVARRLKTPAGEIDIVARRGRTLAIVEVKARATLDGAAFALGPRQQRRLARAAAVAAGRPALAGLDVRFDVVLVAPWRWPRHLKDAWRPAG